MQTNQISLFKISTLSAYALIALLSILSFKARAESDTIYIKTTLNTGYLKGDFNWQIAADRTGTLNPNVLSELSYQDLSGQSIQLNQTIFFKKGFYKNIYLNFESEYGQINQGVVQDSDFDGNNKSEEYSRSRSNPSGSSVTHLLAGIGVNLTETAHHALSVEAGFALNKQSFEKKDGEQVIATQMRTPELGNFAGLNSTYDATWLSGFLGVSERIQINKQQLKLTARFLQTDYQAYADWNLRQDFAHPRSFQHDAVGRGTSIRVSYEIPLLQSLSLALSAEKNQFSTDSGTDTVFYKDGSIGQTKLNEASWNSTHFALGCSYLF